MIIDPSYFKAEIQLANIASEPSVVENINRYITQYEPEYLQKVLGYSLMKDFLAGLQEDPIPQKWVDLLIGAEFTDPCDDRLTKWPGFSAISDISSFSLVPDIIWKVGQPGSPAPGATVFNTTRLVNYDFEIERRAFGTMIQQPGVDADYSLSTDRQTITLLQPGDQFQLDELFIVHLKGLTSIVSSSTVNISPIAYYIYWFIRKDAFTNTVGTGEVIPMNDNSSPVSAGRKMCYAWNNMVDLNYVLWQFLWVNRETYNLADADWWSGNIPCCKVLKGTYWRNMANKVNDMDI